MWYFKTLPEKSPWVFFRIENLPGGEKAYHPLKLTSLYNLIRRTAKRLGIKRINLQAFRRSGASLLLNNGVDLKAVSEYLGHKSVRITADRYAHLSVDKKRTVAQTMDTLWTHGVKKEKGPEAKAS